MNSASGKKDTVVLNKINGAAVFQSKFCLNGYCRTFAVSFFFNAILPQNQLIKLGCSRKMEQQYKTKKVNRFHYNHQKNNRMMKENVKPVNVKIGKKEGQEYTGGIWKSEERQPYPSVKKYTVVKNTQERAFYSSQNMVILYKLFA